MDRKLFDLAEEYDSQLQKGLDLSGESAEYFSRGRVADLRRRLPFRRVHGGSSILGAESGGPPNT